jgi:hypothetical protein
VLCTELKILLKEKDQLEIPVPIPVRQWRLREERHEWQTLGNHGFDTIPLQLPQARSPQLRDTNPLSSPPIPQTLHSKPNVSECPVAYMLNQEPRDRVTLIQDVMSGYANNTDQRLS